VLNEAAGSRGERGCCPMGKVGCFCDPSDSGTSPFSAWYRGSRGQPFSGFASIWHERLANQQTLQRMGRKPPRR
jgi:hypothetical protein